MHWKNQPTCQSVIQPIRIHSVNVLINQKPINYNFNNQSTNYLKKTSNKSNRESIIHSVKQSIHQTKLITDFTRVTFPEDLKELYLVVADAGWSREAGFYTRLLPLAICENHPAFGPTAPLETALLKCSQQHCPASALQWQQLHQPIHRRPRVSQKNHRQTAQFDICNYVWNGEVEGGEEVGEFDEKAAEEESVNV